MTRILAAPATDARPQVDAMDEIFGTDKRWLGKVHR
jgi:hypothetical protein